MIDLQVLARAKSDLIAVINLQMTANLNASVKSPKAGAVDPLNSLISRTFQRDAATIGSGVAG